jgi:hypothetical protein
MGSRSRVETTSYGYDGKIKSITNSSSSGDTPLGEVVAGATAGEIGKGHAAGHADYLARTKSAEIYMGKGMSGGSGDSSGLGEIKSVLGIIKGLL